MKRWLWILCCASFSGIAGGQAVKTFQIAENNLVIRFTEPRAESVAREVLATAENARQELAEKYKCVFSAQAEIHLSATTYEFCQITGRPWWQASVYRGRVIYLQPVRILRERGILATTLRHELMHQLVEEHSKGNSPIWLGEALAIYHSGEIAWLKPARQKVGNNELQWDQLEKRLERTPNKAEAERLYFQLYHLGRFLEANFNAGQITALLIQLGEKTPFSQACQNNLGSSAKEIEQRWLQHWAKSME